MLPSHETRTTSQEARALDMRAALKQALAQLRAAAVPSHTLAAELLLMHTLGRERAWLYAHPEEPLSAEDAERYFALIARRAEGVPTQYLTGKQEFWGLEFEVTPAVLIPRPETEHVVEVALERLGPPSWEEEAAGRARGTGLRIADVGTGSGCLAVALARELPGARVVATDNSAAALEVARRNAARHNVAAQIEFLECHLLDGLERGASPPSDSASEAATGRSSLVTHHSSLHLVVSNPPYVARREAHLLPREVREHEPHAALFAGEDGCEVYGPLVAQAARLLAPGGALVLELGYDSLGRVRSLLDSATWRDVAVTRDLAGIPRVLSARRV